ncbi:MAG TPA: LysR family transcriptional regulator [Polyangiaceae bacterium]
MAELDAKLLGTLRAVAQAGKISAAARLLHVSQPAVTAQIRKLEAQCGRPLLTRSVRGVVPTEAGSRLVGYATQVDALLAEALDDVSADVVHGGELHLGASTTSASHLLPKIVAAFLRQVGPVRVRIDEGNTEQVLEKLEAGEITLGIVEGPTRAPRVRLTPFVEDELVPVVAANAPPPLRSLRRLADLKHVPILWREAGSGTRHVVERALAKIGRKPLAIDLEPGGTNAIRAMTLEGLGVAFLSRLSVQADLDRGALRLLAFDGLKIPRHFSWATAAGDVPGVEGRFYRFAQSLA